MNGGSTSESLYKFNRCECGHCDLMTTSAEYVCCKEISRTVANMGEANDPTVTCITSHPGFECVCLNICILQAAYFQYRQEHKTASSPTATHEYVQLVTNTMHCTHTAITFHPFLVRNTGILVISS